MKNQILRVVNSRYKGKRNLILLCIQENRLKSKLVFEDLTNFGEDHPHVYGVINKNAIVGIVDFKPDQNGSFSIPKELEKFF